MTARKDNFIVRSHFLPDNTQYSVPQLAEVLGMSRSNAREILFAQVAEFLYDPRGNNPAVTFSSSNRSLKPGEEKKLLELLYALERQEAIHRDLSYEAERVKPQQGTIKELEKELAQAQKTAQKILDQTTTDLPRDSAAIVKKLEGRPTLSQQGLDILLAAEEAPTDQLAVNVRVRAGRKLMSPLDTERPYIGWNRQFTEKEADLSTSRWWPELTRHDVIGLPFIVSLSGFVVRAGRIKKRIRNEFGRVGYEVDWTDSKVREDWFGKRVPNKQGAIIGFLND